MQRSAPGLKNARRRLTIRPPLVPTTGTAKPMLKQRKPPADPGLAPFQKNARFPKLIDFFFLEIKKIYRPTAERVSSQRPDLLLAAAAAASFSLLRARPRRSLWLGSRGRSARRTRARGRASAARVQGRRALRRGWERVPGRRVGRGPQRGSGRRCSEDPSPAGASWSAHGAPSPPLAAGRCAERACQHEAGRPPSPQWLRAPGEASGPAAPRGLTVASLAQCPADSKRSARQENCCSCCCHCSLLRIGPVCDSRTAMPSHDCEQPNMSFKESSGVSCSGMRSSGKLQETGKVD